MRAFSLVDHSTILNFLSISLIVSLGQGFPDDNSSQDQGATGIENEEALKSALQKGSVSEVFVTKNILLFPANAPDYVLSHVQEIHAVKENKTGSEDQSSKEQVGDNSESAESSEAKVSEMNEFRLSRIVPSTDSNNTDMVQSVLMNSNPLNTLTSNRSMKNSTIQDPEELLKKVSPLTSARDLFKMQDGVLDPVQNFSIPKSSIMSILTKSLGAATTTKSANSSH